VVTGIGGTFGGGEKLAFSDPIERQARSQCFNFLLISTNLTNRRRRGNLCSLQIECVLLHGNLCSLQIECVLCKRTHSRTLAPAVQIVEDVVAWHLANVQFKTTISVERKAKNSTRKEGKNSTKTFCCRKKQHLANVHFELTLWAVSVQMPYI
jgi:hypothetical protein